MRKQVNGSGQGVQSFPLGKLTLLIIGALVVTLLVTCTDLKSYLKTREQISKISQHPDSVELRGRLWKKEGDQVVPTFPDDLVYRNIEYAGVSRYWIARVPVNSLNYSNYDDLKVALFATKSLDDYLEPSQGIGGGAFLPNFSRYDPGKYPDNFDENRIWYAAMPLARKFVDAALNDDPLSNKKPLIQLSTNTQPIDPGLLIDKPVVGYPPILCRDRRDQLSRCQFNSISGSIAEADYYQFVAIEARTRFPLTTIRYYTDSFGGAEIVFTFHSRHISRLYEIDDYVWNAIKKAIYQDNSKLKDVGNTK